MTRLDPATRQDLRFMGSLLELLDTLLDTQGALDQSQFMSSLRPVQNLLDAHTFYSRDP